MLALAVKDLKKIYANGLHALKGITLNVQPGDFFGLLGQNGAGKSTTIGILCSLVKKTSGKVSIFEYDLDQDLEGAKSCLGVVPQEINFNPFEKVLQVIVYQAGYYGIRRKEALRRAEKYLKQLALWDRRDQPIIRLSGGMKRRLMIVRALMNEPKLLILDEPTAGVDVELRHSLWNFLKELNDNGTTIILTTHYLEEAEHLCKHIAIIDQGEIIEHADVKSFINRLHTQTFILDLASPLKTPPSLTNFSYRILDERTMEIEIKKDFSMNNLFAELSSENILVHSMRNKTNRLEELFVRLIRQNKGSRT